MKEKAVSSKQAYILQIDRIGRLMAEYSEIYEELVTFLTRLNSDESDREMASQKVVMCSLEDKVNDFIEELDSKMSSFFKNKWKLVHVKTESPNLTEPNKVDVTVREYNSVRSKRSSQLSQNLSRHSSIALQRLEAEEGKASLEYTLLKKEKASIQAELEILGAQRMAAVAEAK
jgi:predicted membrane GTPase involved in stress response